MGQIDNRAYYDAFARQYERGRQHPYHRMLDDLEVSLVERYGCGGRVLEVGCGTGLLLQRVAGFARRALGVDLSGVMLAQARKRGLEVVQADAGRLPYPDECFDVVCSFKVLAHIRDVRAALGEMARVTKRGGYVLAEFYNSRSLRYWVKALKAPTPVSDQVNDRQVFTRYDCLSRIKEYLPATLRWETARGVRILTPTALAHSIPGVGSLLRFAEVRLADHPIAHRWGGFLVAVARKH